MQTPQLPQLGSPTATSATHHRRNIMPGIRNAMSARRTGRRAISARPVPGGGGEGLPGRRGEVDGLLWFGTAAGLLDREDLEIGDPEVKAVAVEGPGDPQRGGQGLRCTVGELEHPGRGAREVCPVREDAETERHGGGHVDHPLGEGGVAAGLRLTPCRGHAVDGGRGCVVAGARRGRYLAGERR